MSRSLFCESKALTVHVIEKHRDLDLFCKDSRHGESTIHRQ